MEKSAQIWKSLILKPPITAKTLCFVCKDKAYFFYDSKMIENEMEMQNKLIFFIDDRKIRENSTQEVYLRTIPTPEVDPGVPWGVDPGTPRSISYVPK